MIGKQEKRISDGPFLGRPGDGFLIIAYWLVMSIGVDSFIYFSFLLNAR
jgi:hypothetical protein